MLRMRTAGWVLLWVLSAGVSCAQSAKDALAAFRASVQKQQLVLRNFSGEEKVHASWTGSALELDPPQWRTMGVLAVDSVKLKRDRLTLECTRRVAIRNTTDGLMLYATPAPVEIDVDLEGADPTAALPQMKAGLFYPSVEDAVSAIPDKMRRVIPARMDNVVAASTDKTKPGCDCMDRDKPACDADHRRIEEVVPPKYLGGRTPHYSVEARKARLNGWVRVALLVDNAGHPESVWVARPLGMGLDEEAAKSVLTYVFRPAMCHQTPVTVYLDVDVDFAIR
jgi:hypothetical protein